LAAVSDLSHRHAIARAAAQAKSTAPRVRLARARESGGRAATSRAPGRVAPTARSARRPARRGPSGRRPRGVFLEAAAHAQAAHGAGPARRERGRRRRPRAPPPGSAWHVPGSLVGTA
jgi:hypothetical protein